jgi:hypothetical protein
VKCVHVCVRARAFDPPREGSPFPFYKSKGRGRIHERERVRKRPEQVEENPGISLLLLPFMRAPLVLWMTMGVSLRRSRNDGRRAPQQVNRRGPRRRVARVPAAVSDVRSDMMGGGSPQRVPWLKPQRGGGGRLPSWPVTSGCRVRACPHLSLRQRFDL